MLFPFSFSDRHLVWFSFAQTSFSLPYALMNTPVSEIRWSFALLHRISEGYLHLPLFPF